jgi:hypothetical protein
VSVLFAARRADIECFARTPLAGAGSSRTSAPYAPACVHHIYQAAHYQVNPGAVDKVKAAIVEFVEYVTEHEPGTRIYTAWQQQSAEHRERQCAPAGCQCRPPARGSGVPWPVPE